MRTMNLAITLVVAAAASWSPRTAHATSRVRVLSDLPATILVDHRPVGQAPLDVHIETPGAHRIDVRNDGTGVGYSYRVRVPSDRMAYQRISTSFTGREPRLVAGLGQAVVRAPAPRLTPEQEKRRRLVREKVRIRNSVIGAAAINALFNHGPHRHGVFVALFIIEALNELLHP